MNQVTKFMYYIFNRWSEQESIKIYGTDLGCHIWKKYVEYQERHLGELRFYAELDSVCRQKLVDRSIEVYGDEP